MDNLYKISQIAHLFGVSSDTLRLYEERGFFTPAFIDENTKYRYYGLQEILKMDYILQLKGAGLSLSEIKKVVMGELNLDQKHEMLRLQYDQLGKLLSTYDSLMGKDEYQIEFKTYPSHYIISKSVTVNKWEELLKVYEDLTFELIRNHLTFKQFSTAYAKFEGEFSINSFSCTACLEVKPTSHKYVTLVPEQRFISLKNKGAYETLPKAYERLYVFASEHKINLLPYSIEKYIVAYDNLPLSSKYITEINLPISP